jgi:glycosyltransferase involved in cell wall biosynthesis
VRIAIDARELQGKPTGVGRYLGEILAQWNRLPAMTIHDVILCGSEASWHPPPEHLRLSTLTAPGGGTRWEQLALPRLVRQARADVLFSPGYTGPLRCSVPLVLAIHDVSFAARPEWFTWKEGLRRRTLTRMAARRAARVVTISEFSKREIVEHLGIEARKVQVIYPGVTSHTVQRSDTGDENVILYVGSLFNRRHKASHVSRAGETTYAWRSSATTGLRHTSTSTASHP